MVTRSWADYLFETFGIDGDPEPGTPELDELRRRGDEAVNGLIAALDEPDGYCASMAARTLGLLGDASAPVLAALRSRAPAGDRAPWFAKSLGILGDFDWVIDHCGADAAAKATTARLVPFDTHDFRLDYRAVERLLEAGTEGAQEWIATEMRPGSGFVDLRESDVAEALRGLASRHAPLRWHAASVLGAPQLGEAVGRRCVPALTAALSDDNLVVRRLAFLSLAGC